MAAKVIDMGVEGYKRRERPKTRWMECMKKDMNKNKVSIKMTSDKSRLEGKKHTAPTSNKIGIRTGICSMGAGR